MEPLLLRLARQLSPNERRAVADLTRLPALNRRPEVTRLAGHLAASLEKPTPGALTPESLFAAAYPGVPFDGQRLRHVQSYLLAIIRRYLAGQEWQDEAGAEERYFLKALRRRGLDDLFEREWKTAGEELGKIPVRDARYHLHRYEWLREHGEYTTRRHRSADIDLQPMPDALTAFYLTEMLAHACSALTHQAMAGTTYRFEVLDAVLNAAEEPTTAPAILRHLETPAISVYLHAYRALQPGSSTEEFEALKTALAENATIFTAEEIRGLYLLAINACIRRMNTGSRAYVREAFELYRAALENGFLLENGTLSGFSYKNIVRLAGGLGEYAWAEGFLEQYRPSLHARERDNVYRYNRAYLFFIQRDYARAMPLLRQVDFNDDPLHNLDARRLLLRSYYELGEWDALESLVHSFSAYLRRQKHLGYHRTTNEKLLYFTRKLLEINKDDKAGRQKLRAELEAVTDVAERAWLLDVV